MRQPLLAALTLMLVLGGCGGFSARLNPFNWFGGSQETQTAALAVPIDADPRPLVEQVTFMTVEPMQGGAIVRATGLPPTQGHWDAELVPRPLDENGVLVYDFRLVPPLRRADVSTQQSREVQVAAFLSDFKLDSIRQITVQGAANARSSRR
ncbi:hypothetical protein GEU84_002955 [Fertoebacter nigrum]|uniref:Lipoprotein n=1 Tax=Fertoeibacter niger TaxID=2656921 RepID=A0A8X8GXN3_9RHOB|nr:hypothetical protein [Fertoeibacter niger]NUB43331.1 hypothetical protein [Fertoeibacter niger]